MRKRDKIRISQDVRPWIKLRTWDDEKLTFLAKKTVRQFIGARRDRQTKIFNAALQSEIPKIFIRAFMTDLQKFNSEKQAHLRSKYQRLNRWAITGKAKNFCLMLGKGRTYNRRLFLSRQAFRELVNFGLISGIQN